MALDHEPPNPPPVRLVRDADAGIRFDDEAERAPQTPADVLRAAAGKPVVHVSTGIAALDAHTGGGPRPGDLVVIQGAPDAAKTFFAWQLAEAFADADVVVAFHAIDEAPEKLATRAMQRRGARREDVEARRDLERFLPELPPILMFDSSFSLEQVIAQLARAAGKKRAALFSDSVQKAPSSARAKASGMAEQVSAVVAVLNEAAVQRGWLVVVTSEATRGHYASNDPTAALGSARWSADLDFAAKLLISVAPNKREPEIVAVSLAKNKCGPQVTFRVRVDRDRQTIIPDDPPRPEAKEAPTTARAERRSDADREKVLRVISENDGIGTVRLRKLSGLGAVKVAELTKALDAEKLIEDRSPDPNARRWYASQTNEQREVAT